MTRTDFVRCSAFFAFFILTAAATAAPLTHPAEDPRFTVLADGRDLRSVTVSGSKLNLARGTGKAFPAATQTVYERLKQATKSQANHPMQWVLMDLDSHQIVDSSRDAHLKQFGASVSKIYVAGALMDKQEGRLSSSQLQLMSNMLVVSSNTAWKELQKQIGGGNSDRGREGIHRFTQRMGYERTRGFQGYWGSLHGNELTAKETAEFLYDTYQQNYPGAEVVWKVMHTCRTGANRARKYLPARVYVGGKTGTYDGPTVDPETGRGIKVRVRHHSVVFNVEGRQYGLAVLANTGSDESVSVLAGGLFREYTRPTAR